MLFALEGCSPVVGNNCYCTPTAIVIGRVLLGDDVSIWWGAVVRADTDSIQISSDTNIQDHCMVHTESGFPVKVGRGVTIGHHVCLHGCTIEDYCLIGMGAIIMNGAIIGRESIVGAGCIVTEGQHIPSHSVVVGTPARVIRSTTPKENAHFYQSAKNYKKYANLYRTSLLAII